MGVEDSKSQQLNFVTNTLTSFKIIPSGYFSGEDGSEEGVEWRRSGGLEILKYREDLRYVVLQDPENG